MAKEVTFPGTRSSTEQRAKHAPIPLHLQGPGYLRRENPSKKVQWASGKRRTSSTDSDSKSYADPSKVSRSRRPSRLTVKYDRGQLQRWLEMEQWVDSKVQELFQDQPTPSEPEIDLEALMELPTEEQKTQLEAILRDCTRPTEPFISELLNQLKKLRRLSRPQK
ncbi:protein phosphatase 1 regulatory subunit 14D isoform X2 [Rhinolophus sinicus]|uniref:protein phosphatase 1 regulatory subunit 14D isoform X2 n=1 Tax=Rhinolophus sinicus TaxID=89399 RepID=UPI000942C5CE|nr:PREDICTED: protein phosphatase 1 regulatory subunit 14D isoform X2 [Rhinolophus sinicus]